MRRKKHLLMFVVGTVVVMLAAQGTADAQDGDPIFCIPEDPRPECQGTIVNPPPLPGLGPLSPLPRDGGGGGSGGGGAGGGSGGSGGAPGVHAEPFLIAQESEQDVESGDASQNFTITGGGDNSSSCQGVQGVINTGNATTNTGVLQYANEDAGVEVQDSGNLLISPSQTASCDQRVNQAATASG